MYPKVPANEVQLVEAWMCRSQMHELHTQNPTKRCCFMSGWIMGGEQSWCIWDKAQATPSTTFSLIFQYNSVVLLPCIECFPGFLFPWTHTPNMTGLPMNINHKASLCGGVQRLLKLQSHFWKFSNQPSPHHLGLNELFSQQQLSLLAAKGLSLVDSSLSSHSNAMFGVEVPSWLHIANISSTCDSPDLVFSVSKSLAEKIYYHWEQIRVIEYSN